MEKNEFGCSDEDKAREYMREYYHAHQDGKPSGKKRSMPPPSLYKWEMEGSGRTRALCAFFCSVIAHAALDYITAIYMRQQGMSRLLYMGRHRSYTTMLRYSREAHEYIFSDDYAGPMSFVNLCGEIGFEPSAIRKALARFPLLNEDEQEKMLYRLVRIHPRSSQFYPGKVPLLSSDAEERKFERMFAELAGERKDLIESGMQLVENQALAAEDEPDAAEDKKNT
jgi:hypothetical protein